MDENNNQSENDIRSDIMGWSDILLIDNTHNIDNENNQNNSTNFPNISNPQKATVESIKDMYQNRGRRRLDPSFIQLIHNQ